MFACPCCEKTALTQVRNDAGVLWHCPKCDGRAITLSMLRRRAPNEYVGALWQTVRSEVEAGGFRGRKSCPSCRRRMVKAQAPAEAGDMELDICDACHFVWLDKGEIEALPAAEVVVELDPPLDPRVREALAIAEVSRMRTELDDLGAPPAEWWQVVCSLLGMPIEENAEPVRNWPLVTWTIGLVMVVLTVWGMATDQLDDLVRNLGLIPSDLWRDSGVTLLTSLFLHGGLIHLLGNLYFLLVFGDNSEASLGWLKFSLMFLLAGLAGDVCHIAFDARSDVPLIGASGAISGVLAYYAMRFPHVRIVYLFRIYLYFQFIRMSARWALAIWVGLQLLGAWKQIAGFSNVSALAHLGGAAAGLAFFWFDRWWNERGTVGVKMEDGRPSVYRKDY